MKFYGLNSNREVVPADGPWALVAGPRASIVAYTSINGRTIATIFYGLEEPLLGRRVMFATIDCASMDEKDALGKAETWEEAEQVHLKVVAAIAARGIADRAGIAELVSNAAPAGAEEGLKKLFALLESKLAEKPQDRAPQDQGAATDRAGDKPADDCDCVACTLRRFVSAGRPEGPDAGTLTVIEVDDDPDAIDRLLALRRVVSAGLPENPLRAPALEVLDQAIERASLLARKH